MSIQYTCRYCGTVVGEINSEHINELQLGFHFLTPDERKDIISYNQHGQVTVNVACDYCNEAIKEHPELSLLSNPLQ